MSIILTGHISLESSEQIKNICKPLFESLDLCFFRYLRVYPSGKRIHLCSNPEWTERFYQDQLYKIAWLDGIHFNTSKPHQIIWDEYNKEINDAVTKARNSFKFFHGISILKPALEYYEIYDFATSEENAHINQIYHDHTELLDHFIFYFKDQAKELITMGEKDPIHVFIQAKPNSKNLNIKNFILNSPIKRFYINTAKGDVYLTKKELECLYWVTLGKNAEEIALILTTAKRTIELHLEKIRIKLDCPKITQAIKVVIDNGLISAYQTLINI